MDITLSVKADYKAASKAFNELASSSEATRQKIEKFSKSFQSENLNKFIDKQKLIQTAITATKGEMAAMISVQNNYENEITRLIKSGLDPESDAIKKLRTEYDKLKVQTDGQKKSTVDLKSQITASIPAIGAAVAAYQTMSAALRTVKQFMDDSIKAYTEQEKANARLQEVIFATGASAWTSADQLKSFAKNLADSTGNSAKDIQDLQSVLLGFK
jgi:vacuolar-type H+-ATPase subunit I/STV1